VANLRLVYYKLRHPMGLCHLEPTHMITLSAVHVARVDTAGLVHTHTHTQSLSFCLSLIHTHTHTLHLHFLYACIFHRTATAPKAIVTHLNNDVVGRHNFSSSKASVYKDTVKHIYIHTQTHAHTRTHAHRHRHSRHRRTHNDNAVPTTRL